MINKSVQATSVIPQHWVLDANVLFSDWARWLCVGLAARHQSQLYWTPQIEEEVFRNLQNTGRISAADVQMQRLVLPGAMGAQVLTEPFEAYLHDVQPVDPKDRHVAAAALGLRHRQGQSVAIVTWNVRDFARQKLTPNGVAVLTPEQVVLGLSAAQNPTTTRTLLGVFEQALNDLEAFYKQHPLAGVSLAKNRARPRPRTDLEWKDFLIRNRMNRVCKLCFN
ncbi:MAG: PIN domain-containing protein [Limnobacter sp.]|nr:PIN domain-containing protein [Limnobacter sp.]